MNTLYINKIKQISLVLLLAVTAGVTGCKKGTFDINSPNPNAPSPSTVPPKYVLAAALAGTGSLTFGGDEDIIDVWMGYYTTSGGYTPSPVYATYQLTGSVASGNYDDAYINAGNYQTVINAASADPTLTNYKAVALIMKSFVLQRVVDLYNSVPYSQAFNASILNPKYDDPATIYTSLINNLDTAINLIKTASAATTPIESKYDVVYGGNTASWRVFANTLKLKMLMRLTQTATGAALAAKELSGLSIANGDFIGMGQDAGLNPGYSSAADNQENPFYIDVNKTSSGSAGYSRNYWRACSYAVNFYKSLKDPRDSALYEIKTSGAAKTRDVWGLALGTLAVASNDSISGVFGPAYASSPSQSVYILPAFESLFLQAEAVQRGYLSGNAASLYTQAVEASFVLTGAYYPNLTPLASADQYLSTSTSPLVNWTEASDKINLIITQKYLACNEVDPLEAYSDYRRLGIPSNLALSSAPQNTVTHIPYRLVYPTSETSYNAANVPSGTSQDTKVFWMP